MRPGTTKDESSAKKFTDDGSGIRPTKDGTSGKHYDRSTLKGKESKSGSAVAPSSSSPSSGGALEKVKERKSLKELAAEGKAKRAAAAAAGISTKGTTETSPAEKERKSLKELAAEGKAKRAAAANSPSSS